MFNHWNDVTLQFFLQCNIMRTFQKKIMKTTFSYMFTFHQWWGDWRLLFYVVSNINVPYMSTMHIMSLVARSYWFEFSKFYVPISFFKSRLLSYRWMWNEVWMMGRNVSINYQLRRGASLTKRRSWMWTASRGIKQAAKDQVVLAMRTLWYVAKWHQAYYIIQQCVIYPALLAYSF